MQVVSNTSSLSALSIIGRLGLLRSQFGTIRIPRAVWTELSRLEHVSGKQALQQAHAEGWIQVHETANRPMIEILD
jgi:predicted nucleic acid-binding protein